ncbi:exported protein of unknown function [uncultured Sphingopyxis sp.]|uniref:Uncharacterized protein n=1 Tax=uncultured Sphingopyxis sp. TaxID=310581 RepID=A0A1Y5PW42_9SPHN|nr:exported protein of unknown function [uncultured Sphingopyxis sp.]
MSLHCGVTLVIAATTSIALASRLVAGSNSVMSPVCSGTATAGQALRVAVIPTPPAIAISLSFAQPAAVATAAVPHSTVRNLRDGNEMDIMMIGLSKQAHGTRAGTIDPASCAPLLIGAMNAAQQRERQREAARETAGGWGRSGFTPWDLLR